MQVVHEVHDRIMPLPLPCMMIMVMDAMRFDSKKMAASSSLQVKSVSKCFFHHPLLSELSASAPSNRHHHLQQDLRVSPVRVQSVKKQSAVWSLQ